jgi:hypothetical protein
MRVSPVFLIAAIASLAFTPVSADPDSAQPQAAPAQAAVAQPATIQPATAQATPAQPAAMAAAAPDPLDQIVCHVKPPPTGSMLGGGRECHTQRDWNHLQTQSQNGVSGFQQRSLQNMPTGTGLSAK